MSNWIRLHRKSLESRVFSDPNLWRVWCWCLIKSNWKRGWYLGCELQPGQFATGREAASKELSVSGSSWYRSMQKLQELGCIRLEVNNRFTKVSIVNWAIYQVEVNSGWTTDEQQTDSGWTTSEQRVDTIEEGKEGLEGKERKETNSRKRETVFSDQFKRWWSMYPRKVGKKAAWKAYQSAVATIAKNEGVGEPEAESMLHSWTRDRVSDVAAFEVQYQPHPATWLNSGRYYDEVSAPKSRVASIEELEAWTPQ